MARIIEVTEAMHNTEQGGQQVHIPEGEYLLEIGKVAACSEKQFADESKNPWMAVRTTIADGPVKSRPYSELLTWSPEGQFRMGRFLAAFGVGLLKVGTKLDYVTFNRYAAALTKALAGKKIGTYIGDNDYNGRVTSQVMEFYAAADYEDRKGSSPVTTRNGVPPADAGNPLAAFEGALGDLLPQADTV